MSYRISIAIFIIFVLFPISFSIISPGGHAIASGVENALVGDVDSDGQVDLPDMLISLQVAAGIPPEPSIFNSVDLNGDQQIGIVEAIFCMQWIAGLQSPAEDWRADLSDVTGDSFGSVDFTLNQDVFGSVVACGSYEVQFAGEVITGDFDEQPVTINGSQISSEYDGTMVLPPEYGGSEVSFTLSLNGTTSSGTGSGSWQVDFDHPLIPDLAGTWSGQRTLGKLVTR